jgi:hypothetical protein
VLPLTTDLDRVYTTLMDYRAEGGGDTPEDVRRALHDGVTKTGWSKRSPRLAQVLFLVGDSPPHEDYADEPDVLATTADAVRAGLIVDTIQCESSEETRRVWEKIAQRGEGRYFAIAQGGAVQSVSTRFDGRITELGRKLGSTYAAYGGGGGEHGVAMRRSAARVAASTESIIASGAPAPAQADRAINKAINADAYAGDLYQSIESGKLQLKDVRVADLPDALQRQAPAERAKTVAKQLAERKSLRAEILRLSRLRDADIVAQRNRQAVATGKQPLDAAILAALRQQVARKGIKLRG